MTSAELVEVGALDLLDLNLIGEHRGRDFLPFPFRYTRPTRFTYTEDVNAYAATIPDRLRSGDLAVFAPCVDALHTFDIQVSCDVQHLGSEMPGACVLAVRSGQRGFLAVQRALGDVVDVYAVSPYDLGAAIADTVDLSQPGRIRRIVVPEYHRTSPTERRGDSAVVVRQSGPSLEVRVPSALVSAYSTVQSRWRRARQWGLDQSAPKVVWLSVEDDGDYLYAPDLSHAVPVTREALRERIDRLIAADVAMLRESRGEAGESSGSLRR